MSMPTTELTLWYGTTMIGRVRDAFCTDATWYGMLDRAIAPADGPLASHLLEFMAFCEDWNRRSVAAPDNPPDPGEFDRFVDVIKSGLWFTQTTTGEKQPVIEAPNFTPGGELSWRVG